MNLQIAEFDRPEVLQANPESLFSGMLAAAQHNKGSLDEWEWRIVRGDMFPMMPTPKSMWHHNPHLTPKRICQGGRLNFKVGIFFSV